MKNSFKSSVHLISGNVFAKIVGILLLSYLTRFFAKEEIAVIPIYAMLAELSIVLLSFGIFPTFNRNLPSLLREKPTVAYSFIASGSTLIIFGVLVVSTIIFIYKDQLAQLLFDKNDYAEYFIYMCVGFVALAVKRINLTILTCLSKFKDIALLQAFEAIVNASLLVVLTYKYRVFGLAIALAANELINSMTTSIIVYKYLKGWKFSYYPFFTILSKSLPFYLETYLMYFRSQGDSWIITTFLGPASMAIYYVAKTIYATLFMFFQSIDKVVTQKMAENKNNYDYINNYLNKFLSIVSTVAIPLVILTIAMTPSIVHIIAGGAYSDAVVPAILLCALVGFHMLRMPIVRGVFVLAKPMKRLTLTSIETAVMIPLLFITVQVLGIPGVIISQALAIVVGGWYGYWVLKQYIQIKINWNENVHVVTVLILPTVLMLILQDQYLSFLVIPFYGLAAIFIFFITLRYIGPISFQDNIVELLPQKVRCIVNKVLPNLIYETKDVK